MAASVRALWFVAAGLAVAILMNCLSLAARALPHVASGPVLAAAPVTPAAGTAGLSAGEIAAQVPALMLGGLLGLGGPEGVILVLAAVFLAGGIIVLLVWATEAFGAWVADCLRDGWRS